jgi:hypothetical protein
MWIAVLSLMLILFFKPKPPDQEMLKSAEKCFREAYTTNCIRIDYVESDLEVTSNEMISQNHSKARIKIVGSPISECQF